jgi:hypothetical protein
MLYSISPAVFAHVLGRSCRPPGMTGLSYARLPPLPGADDDALCWVHHNHCERDEIVLEPAFMIRYLKGVE